MKKRSEKVKPTQTLYKEVYDNFKCGHGRLWYITDSLGKPDNSLLEEAENCLGGEQCKYKDYEDLYS